MKATGLLFLFSFLYIVSAAQQTYWQQQANYVINVKLDDVEQSLEGNETIEYQNNSNDTLLFIWVHLWPNAYKNDRTAFTEQQLINGSTDFYFSNEDDKGYINRLAFKVDCTIAVKEDHPQHQDIIKLILPTPLAPQKSCLIETPFHVKLPYNFSRGGHIGQSYQVTQWYPKVAVYDKKGWHEIPYLDQGEFYSDFGNYEVSITLPENYTVAATGELIKETIQPAPIEGILINRTPVKKETTPFLVPKKNNTVTTPSSKNLKTITYKQNDVIDFAWFADKNFIIKKDTLLLPSGKIINVAAYSLPAKEEQHWENATKHIKETVLQRSRLIGEYPYNTATVVEGRMKYSGGMEYPTISILSGYGSLGSLIDHEVGHNWFYGIIATNEREHPWMDEGMNTYYENYRYKNNLAATAPALKNKQAGTFFTKRLPESEDSFLLSYYASEQRTQPIETSSQKLSLGNYELSAYYKPSQWMFNLEKTLGTEMFDNCMREYYRQWKFKHPYPDDFKKVMEQISNKNLDSTFYELKTKNYLPQSSSGHVKRKIKLNSFFSFKETGKYKYIFASPAIGMNKYDKVMIGVLLHNYTIPQEKFSFLIAPLYATGSKGFTGIGRIDYKVHQGENGEKLIFSLAGATFNGDVFIDSTGKNNFLRFSKLVPGIKYVFANNNPLSHVTKYVQWKTFFINEKLLLFKTDTVNHTDNISYPTNNRYVNQLKFVIDNNRVLYPHSAILEAEQGKNFARVSFTGNYFFNYAKGGGMNVRLFAGKFFYLQEKTFAKQFETDPYQLNMTGPKGYEDYTYSNYFAGRNEFNGFASQQIMQRDGFFKVRTDLLSSKIGKSDNWLAAANFSSDLPKAINPLQVLPIKIPLKIFVDIGSYAEAWQKNSGQQKFIFDAGLQLSLLHNTVNIYAPILYSKVYKDYIRSTNPGFVKNISFSVDIQNFTLRKLIPQFAF